MMNRMQEEDFNLLLTQLSEAIASLEQTPASLEHLLRQIPDDSLTVRNHDEFSAVENICHLRDIEIEGYGERISRIIQEDNPSLPDLDGGRLAIERAYNTQDAGVALDAFRVARQWNVQVLRGLSLSQFAREGSLENVGVVSIEKLMELMMEHDQGHLDELMMICNRHKHSSGTARI